MKKYSKIALFLCMPLFLFSFGCGKRSQTLVHFSQSEALQKDLKKLVRENPIPEGKDILALEIGRTENLSYHLVQITGSEKPHVHEKHDLVVMLEKGYGLLHMGGKTFEMKRGGVLVVPKGTAHYFENKCKCGSTAFTVFSPPFDGKDMKVVKE